MSSIVPKEEERLRMLLLAQLAADLAERLKGYPGGDVEVARLRRAVADLGGQAHQAQVQRDKS